MMRVTAFKGRSVAVFGLGASGLATARALIDGGATVAAWDDSETGRVGAADADVPLVDLNATDWTGFAALVLAPGVPLTHPEPHWTVRKASSAGVEVIGDVELLFRERASVCPAAPVVAITGTNGKSTTTALIAHLLTELGCSVDLGGNIGRAVLTLEPPQRGRIYVLELSSFQIDLTPTLTPTVGVMLNVTPDHIDRHGTVAHYAAVKERLVTGAEAACIGLDDEFARTMAKRRAGREVYAFSAQEVPPSEARFFARGAGLFMRDGPREIELASLTGVRSLRGRHNVQNALAAFAAIRALEDRLAAQGESRTLFRREALARALATFPGLPHRMEEIGSLGRVLFINDSKATNADSTEKALASWERGIYWIVGGKPKDGGIEMLEPYFPRIARAYLIGEASEVFARTLEGKVSFERCGTLDLALDAAMNDAAAGAFMRGGNSDANTEPVVLLSPACASYDQYKNFEQRGDHFRALVANLPGVDLAGGPRTRAS